MDKNILIIGNRGYIGSKLKLDLEKHNRVTGIDIGWYDQLYPKCDYRKLEKQYLEQFDVIVLLGGHSSVKTCLGDIASPWLNNVTNFSDLIDKIDNQLVIYASSASVYGNSLLGQQHNEQILNFMPVNNYDITKYSLDMAGKLAIAQGKNVVGLRFGTVNGWSPILRVDVMINAMYHSAIQNKQIVVTNTKINRALLGIEDLSRAISCIIENPQSGIYNLSSFNTSVENIGTLVADKLNVPLIEKDPLPGVYDFELNCNLFSETYDFTFQETPNTIIDSLIKNYKESICVRRDQYINYQWN